MSVLDWEEEKFNNEFESTILQVENLRRIDPSFTIESLRSKLESAYVHDGNNWTGRGSVGDISHEAVIAAYEQYLARWEKELAESENNED